MQKIYLYFIIAHLFQSIFKILFYFLFFYEIFISINFSIDLVSIHKNQVSLSMVTRLKHNRKLRGHVSAGHGRIGKHRKHPGGRGLAGGWHHKRIMFNKYHPGYFGKCGIRRFHQNMNETFMPTINVDQLWSLVPEERRAELVEKADETCAPIIDVTQHGYFKVLGRGLMPKCPVIVRCKSISAIAEKRIKSVGGVVQLVA